MLAHGVLDHAKLCYKTPFFWRLNGRGMPITFSFPTQPVLSLYAGPRFLVGLVLALAAAVIHLALLSLG